MRIYNNLMSAIREVERDLWEMGINVHPQTMQDKRVMGDADYETRELQAYGFQIAHGYRINNEDAREVVNYILGGRDVKPELLAPEVDRIIRYIHKEFSDRWFENKASNPGMAYEARKEIWNEFLHNGKFSYTYSERINPQRRAIINELKVRPDTRQAIINIHSNICPAPDPAFEAGKSEYQEVKQSHDLSNMGGNGRIPCSLYYQFLRRNNRLDMIYAMRSCDFLTHFYVDVILALMTQAHVAFELDIKSGNFTYFTGSLHAYNKDMKTRGIF